MSQNEHDLNLNNFLYGLEEKKLKIIINLEN